MNCGRLSALERGPAAARGSPCSLPGCNVRASGDGRRDRDRRRLDRHGPRHPRSHRRRSRRSLHRRGHRRRNRRPGDHGHGHRRLGHRHPYRRRLGRRHRPGGLRNDSFHLRRRSHAGNAEPEWDGNRDPSVRSPAGTSEAAGERTCHRSIRSHAGNAEAEWDGSDGRPPQSRAGTEDGTGGSWRCLRRSFRRRCRRSAPSHRRCQEREIQP
jgi:hypothetical protein